MSLFSHDLIWWITVIDLPALSALFVMIWRMRKDFEAGERAQSQALSDFKLDVAKTYASMANVRELEARIVAHLLRIEAKLDRTALKAAGFKQKGERTHERD